MIVHPNSCSAWGHYCPIKILDTYLAARLKLDPASGDDWLFPNLDSTYARFNVQTVSISLPCTQFLYENYRRRLKVHLDTAELREMGVFPKDYSTHSFRKGGLSVLGADCTVTPAFL